MLNIVLALFRGLPLGWKLGGIGLVMTMLAGVYGYWHYQVYQSGYQAAIEWIAAQDKEAVNAAAQARNRVNECRASGRLWDVESGKCVGG